MVILKNNYKKIIKNQLSVVAKIDLEQLFKYYRKISNKATTHC